MGMAYVTTQYIPLWQRRGMTKKKGVIGFWDNYEFRSLDTRWPRQQVIGHSLPGILERVWRPPEALGTMK